MLFIQTTLHEGFEESNFMGISKHENPSFTDAEVSVMNSMVTVNSIDKMKLLEYKLCIPKDYARGNEAPGVFYNADTAEKVPHYELYIEKQIGSVRNRRNTYIYLKLPKSGKLVTIILYMDGGVGFDPLFHKYIIRELDATDRRIILGFCLANESSLEAACYETKNSYKTSLELNAARYKITDMPKRLKTGSRGNDFTSYYHDLKPYEETCIFSSLKFI